MALHMARSDSSASRGRVAVQRCFCSSAGSSPEGLVTLRAGVERAAPLEATGTALLLSTLTSSVLSSGCRVKGVVLRVEGLTYLDTLVASFNFLLMVLSCWVSRLLSRT